MRRISLLLFALLALNISMVAADPLYKWVDDQGNVHYSDKPQPGAKKINLPPPSTFTPVVPAEVPAPGQVNSDNRFKNRKPNEGPSKQDGQSQHIAYTQFDITSPKPDDVLWNVTSVTVSLAVQPALQAGDKVTITLDSASQGPMSSTSATFDNLDRGEHTISASLQAADGSVMATKSVTFTIQRATQKTLMP